MTIWKKNMLLKITNKLYTFQLLLINKILKLEMNWLPDNKKKLVLYIKYIGSTLSFWIVLTNDGIKHVYFQFYRWKMKQWLPVPDINVYISIFQFLPPSLNL
jgi:hypothetical protein